MKFNCEFYDMGYAYCIISKSKILLMFNILFKNTQIYYKNHGKYNINPRSYYDMSFIFLFITYDNFKCCKICVNNF